MAGQSLGRWRAVPRPESLEAKLARRLRERTRPDPADDSFTHLLDLRDALAGALADATGTWLDFGAGTAPYTGLLPGAELRTAEITRAESYPVDYELDAAGRCPVPDGTFDGVLSTQVLEHVPEPAAYLAEACRLLRPGGRLVLSTHGVWEDHLAVDLWRWTADGLAKQLAAAGFLVERVDKLTCGPRALSLLLLRYLRDRAWTAPGPVGPLLGVLRLLDRLFPSWINRYVQHYFAAQRNATGAAEWFYLAVLVQARRP